MRIRRFRIGDATALHDVFFSAIHQIAARDYSPEQINAWAPLEVDPTIWSARLRGIDPFVVEAYGQILGYADVQSTGYIDHFFVSALHSRRGVGRLLMNRIHEEAAPLV